MMMSTVSRISVEQKVAFKMLLVFLIGLAFADPLMTSAQDVPVCDPHCGCDGKYIYDSFHEECVLNLKKLMKRTETRYDNSDSEVFPPEEAMAKSIYIEGQKLFQGILVSVILFITCAAICVLSACIYCCRMNYSDQKLKKDVKALAKKMKKDYDPKQQSSSNTVSPKAESCNVVVEEAGVFVV